ncbi:MAG: putative holin [Betaproteobacteria bacterium]|nr:putative holin [Betaproteobacteria bacterium]
MKLPRLTLWLVISVALLGAVLVTAPMQFPVALFKLSLITASAWLAYWIDRGLFPYARPDAFILGFADLDAEEDEVPGAEEGDGGNLKSCVVSGVPLTGAQIAFSAAMLRRALIIGAAMIAAALGA